MYSFLKVVKSFSLLAMLFNCGYVYSQETTNDYISKKIEEFADSSLTLDLVYNIETPDEGFPPFYVYFWKKNSISFNGKDSIVIYPFVYQDEKEWKRSRNGYSRCNVGVVYNGKMAIPNRKFESGNSTDSSPCLGYNQKYKSIVGLGNDIVWLVFNVAYRNAILNIEESREVYFLSKNKNKLCYSERITGMINRKVKMNLKTIGLEQSDFDECGDFATGNPS